MLKGINLYISKGCLWIVVIYGSILLIVPQRMIYCFIIVLVIVGRFLARVQVFSWTPKVVVELCSYELKFYVLCTVVTIFLL